MESTTSPSTLPISLKFEKVSKPVNGKDVKLNLVLQSEATEPRTLSIDITVVAKKSSGTARYDILYGKKEKTLTPGNDLRVPVVVPFNKYWTKMLDNDLMIVSAIVIDGGDTTEKYLAEDEVVLEDPPFTVEVLGEVFIRRPVSAVLAFVNPSPKTLKDCTITLSGSGLIAEEQDISLPDLEPKKKVRTKVNFFPNKAGEKTLTAEFNCSVLKNIKKSIPVTVQN